MKNDTIDLNVIYFRQGHAAGTYPITIARENILAVFPYDEVEHEVGATVQLLNGVVTPFNDHTRYNHIGVLESVEEIRHMLKWGTTPPPAGLGYVPYPVPSPLPPMYDWTVVGSS